MDKALRLQLTTMRNEILATAIPDLCKQTLLWCIEQLPALYTKFRLTNESRYGEEITRLVQGVLKELAADKTACPHAQKLAASIPVRFRQLHEKFGLPRLNIKSLVASSPRSRKPVFK